MAARVARDSRRLLHTTPARRFEPLTVLAVGSAKALAAKVAAANAVAAKAAVAKSAAVANAAAAKAASAKTAAVTAKLSPGLQSAAGKCALPQVASSASAGNTAVISPSAAGASGGVAATLGSMVGVSGDGIASTLGDVTTANAGFTEEVHALLPETPEIVSSSSSEATGLVGAASMTVGELDVSAAEVHLSADVDACSASEVGSPEPTGADTISTDASPDGQAGLEASSDSSFASTCVDSSVDVSHSSPLNALGGAAALGMALKASTVAFAAAVRALALCTGMALGTARWVLGMLSLLLAMLTFGASLSSSLASSVLSPGRLLHAADSQSTGTEEKNPHRKKQLAEADTSICVQDSAFIICE
eukprot:TRINITY_DN20876_c0_g1_i1.p1 TRINITY_DN20876_c0_g1~~TRINITY_DN20876_c0_g1_i1.p1  ORF type:complete len:363 (+),score=84.88 TRINITY_DN20876_c0_g1_i1:38-1126(+)